MTEIWKDIPGYVGVYQVSSDKKVKSLDRDINGKMYKGKELNTKDGMVALYKDSEPIYFTVDEVHAASFSEFADEMHSIFRILNLLNS